jgi:hypothetical protein
MRGIHQLRMYAQLHSLLGLMTASQLYLSS